MANLITLCLILSTVLGWGFWGIVEAQCVASVGLWPATYVTLFGMAFGCLVGWLIFDISGAAWISLSYVLGAIAACSFLALVARVPAHVAVAATAIYPVVPAIVAACRGALSLRDALGAGLCVSGAVLLSIRE